MQDIKVWQIWEVTSDDFITSWKYEKFNWNRKTILRKWEKIEIRFPHKWHFRTEDNLYFHCEEENIRRNARLYWDIWDNVRFANSAKLSEILSIGLYKKIVYNNSNF